MAGEIVEAREPLSPSRAWWLRVPAVLLGPRPVFFALREDDDDDVAARSEPLLLVIWMAGIASVLATPTAADILDQPEYDTILLAIWAFVAGGLYGFVGYFAVGLALLFGVRLLGSIGDFRARAPDGRLRARPARCLAPLLLPLRLALYGGDTFRAGGADEGAGETCPTGTAARVRRLVARASRDRGARRARMELAAHARRHRRGDRPPSGDRRRVRDDLRRRPRRARARRRTSRTCAAPPGSVARARPTRTRRAPCGSSRRARRSA